jgi:hypothetical protein
MEDVRMKKTLIAMVFSGLMAVGMVGCGSSDSDLVSDMCNKMDSCGYLEGTTVSECKKEGNDGVGDATSAEKDAARKCLSKSCTEFVSCIAGI